MNFKNHIVKWYQTVLLPVFHIDNSGSVQKFNNEGEDPQTKVEIERADKKKKEDKEKSVPMPGAGSRATDVSEDAQAVLDRINSDREGKYLDEVEKARREADETRRKAAEDARLASIMDANKVDVDSFIAQGKSAAKEAEDMRRAQEIIDRLNREAAEDDAAKQAEIDAAMAEASEKFGN